MVGFVFVDAIERLIETQFWVAERQDVTVTFVEPRVDAARYALARLPGVIAVEPQRTVAVRVRVRPPRALPGAHRRAAEPRLSASSTRRPRDPRCRRPASCCRQMLGRGPRRRPATVHGRGARGHAAGARRAVAGLVDDILGLSVYMELDALHRLMREGDVASGALLLVDPAQRGRALAER